MFLRKFSSCTKYFDKKRAVSVVGAVRTPFYDEENPSKTQLASCIIDEVIKRACLPKEDIDEVKLVGLHREDVVKVQGSSNQLHKNVLLEVKNDAIEALSNSIQTLNDSKANVIVICGVDTKKLAFNECLESIGNFDLEIMPIFNRAKRGFISKDEFGENKTSTIATAIALTVTDYPKKVNINPLASLSEVNYDAKSDISKMLTNVLESQNIQKESISSWEFLYPKNIVELLKTHLNLDASKVNTFKLADIIQQMPSISPLISLTHLVHYLQRTQRGFIGVQYEENSYAAFLLEKYSLAPRNLPTLTLYTKDNCSLCDELVEELEQHFENEYHLEKIFIDRKENIRFLRLYRNDIPVLFLNGQFVCMHRLNKKLLRRMLSASSSEENDCVIK